MSLDKSVKITEAYRDYTPPIQAAEIVRELLARVPAEYLRGLHSVVLSNLSGQPRRIRLGKTRSRGRRVLNSRVLGRYHPRWGGQLPWIELYVDQIVRPFPRWALWVPLFKRFAVAQTLYHELGHHIHYTIRPEYKEREDVADEWGRTLGRRFLRRRYWYLIPLVKGVRFFRRK